MKDGFIDRYSGDRLVNPGLLADKQLLNDSYIKKWYLFSIREDL